MKKFIGGSFTYHLKLVVVVVILSVFNHISLRATNYVLTNYIQGYISAPRYLFPGIIFFFASYIAVNFGVKRGWKRLLPYHLYAISVFFPLIFFNAVGRFISGVPLEIQEFYALELCGGNAGEMLCGQALAHMVFGMAMQALPLLLIIPAVFCVLLRVNFLNLLDQDE